jgi:small-conductance mechanosensitive channel
MPHQRALDRTAGKRFGQMTMVSAIHFPAILRLAGAFAFALFLSAALAQQSAEPTPDERLNGLTIILNRIDAALSRQGLSDDELKSLRTEAIDAGAEARAIALAHEPVVGDLRARLEQLKPETAAPEPEIPAEGAPGGGPDTQPAPDEPSETPAPGTPAVPDTPVDPLSGEVAQIEAELLAEEAIVKLARAIETRAQQQASQIVSILRDHFNQRIFGRTTSFLNPAFWVEVARELPASATSSRRVLEGLFERAILRGPIALIPLGVLLLALAFVAVPQLRHRVIALVAKLVGQSEPSDIGKAVTAFLVAGFVTAIPPVSYWAAIFLARTIDAVPPLSTFLLNETGAAILVVAAAFGFTRAILAPGRPDWRIARIGDAPAIYLSRRLPVPALFAGLGLILEGLAEQASFATPVALAAVGLVSLCFALILIEAMRRVRLMLGEPGTAAEGAPASDRFRLARLGAAVAALSGVVILGALVFGYLPFAWFLTKQVVWIALVFATFALTVNLLDAFGSAYFTAESPASTRLTRPGGVSPQWTAQFGVALIGAAKLLAAAIGILLIAAPWGVSSAGLVAKARAALTGFEIGGLSISLTGIAIAVALFAAGIALTRALQRWLRRRYLPLTDIDPGLKASIATATGYLGFIAAVVIAFASVGVDLSRLALVAGALSVGIGFGLQSIVNNFVSGLILLVERPIKAGDWIIVGAEEGTVKNINVRATELETFDRATVVIPNSDLISGTVKNWVLGGTMGRVSIVIGTAYGSDADEVRKILLGCAADHPLVIHYPEPRVFLLDFGDSALMFRLDAYLADISNGFGVRSDIRFEILKRFREAGIEIPFPQRDVNLRASDQAGGVIEKMLGQVGDGSE